MWLLLSFAFLVRKWNDMFCFCWMKQNTSFDTRCYWDAVQKKINQFNFNHSNQKKYCIAEFLTEAADSLNFLVSVLCYFLHCWSRKYFFKENFYQYTCLRNFGMWIHYKSHYYSGKLAFVPVYFFLLFEIRIPNYDVYCGCKWSNINDVDCSSYNEKSKE